LEADRRSRFGVGIRERTLGEVRQLRAVGLDALGRVTSLALLKISTNGDEGFLLATVNFSVPDDVKASFNKTFAGQNKSAVVAELMRRAVDEAELQRRRERLFKRLNASRALRGAATARDVRTARHAGRP
jgi:hypothetical protein